MLDFFSTQHRRTIPVGDREIEVTLTLTETEAIRAVMRDPAIRYAAAPPAVTVDYDGRLVSMGRRPVPLPYLHALTTVLQDLTIEEDDRE